MLKGFKEFILRGNVIDLAVAVVIGAAFTAVVNSIVDSVFNPLISAIFQADSLNNVAVVQIGDAQLRFGAVLGAVIQFLLIAIVVYFVFVVPINHLKNIRPKTPEADTEELPPTETELLTQIRDLLAIQQAKAAGEPVAGDYTPKH